MRARSALLVSALTPGVLQRTYSSLASLLQTAGGWLVLLYSRLGGGDKGETGQLQMLGLPVLNSLHFHATHFHFWPHQREKVVENNSILTPLISSILAVWPCEGGVEGEEKVLGGTRSRTRQHQWKGTGGERKGCGQLWLHCSRNCLTQQCQPFCAFTMWKIVPAFAMWRKEVPPLAGYRETSLSERQLPLT